MKRALDGVIAAFGRYGGERIDLLVGEPCFDPPTVILAEFERLAREPVSGYGPPAGLGELREVLAAWDGGAGAGADEVVVTHGAKGGLLALVAALIEPGDEVIHPLPCYPAYPAMVRRLGGTPVGVAEGGDGFSGWAEAAAAAVGPKTRAVVLSSPSNPSGSMMARDDLEALIGMCRERSVRLLLDEAYAAFRFMDEKALAVDRAHDETLVRIGSASKSLALCGWRMGWVMADPELVARITGAQAALLNPPASPPQRAMLALPDVPATYFENNRREVRRRMEALAAAMRSAGFDAEVPSGGFYLWVDVRDKLDGEGSSAWCENLAAERGVGFWPGEDYGVPGHVRLALPQGVSWRERVAELQVRLGG